MLYELINFIIFRRSINILNIMKSFLSSVSAFLFCLTLLTSLPQAGLAQKQETPPAADLVVRVMSYNIRYDDKGEVDGWDRRKDKVASQMRYHQSDLIGVQEALHHQLKDLEAALPGFRWYGVGRDDGKQAGEYSAILYNTNLFELQESGTFWLSPTPEQPSKGWDAALPRVCSWVKFRHKGTGRSFYHFNTHYDHRGEQARVNSSALLVAKIREIAKDQPVVVTGDFNVPERTVAYKTMVTGTGLKDAKELSQTPHHGPEGSFSGFDICEPMGERIDYVFVKEPVRVQLHGHLAEPQNGRYPSDHLAVLAEIVLPLENPAKRSWFQGVRKSRTEKASVDSPGSLVQQPSKWETEIAAFERQDVENPPAKGGILFTGSSSIRLWENVEKAFPGQPIINRGFGGSEIIDITQNFNRLILPYEPRQIVLYSGDNDVNSGKTAKQVTQDFKDLFGQIRTSQPEVHVVFISIKPSPARWEKRQEMSKANNLIRDFLESRPNTAYVDVWSQMLGRDGKPIAHLYASDGLHLSPEGYEVWNKALYPHLLK